MAVAVLAADPDLAGVRATLQGAARLTVEVADPVFGSTAYALFDAPADVPPCFRT